MTDYAESPKNPFIIPDGVILLFKEFPNIQTFELLKTSDLPIIWIDRCEESKFHNSCLSEELTKVCSKIIDGEAEIGMSEESLQKLLHTLITTYKVSDDIRSFLNGQCSLVTTVKDLSNTDRVLELYMPCGDYTNPFIHDFYGYQPNFLFEVTGPIDDEKMEHFNGIFKKARRKGVECLDVATGERMRYLRKIGCDIQFAGCATKTAKENLIKCGGKEMPAIVGGMLKKFYFENMGTTTSIQDCIQYLAENDVAEYEFDGLEQTYHGKIAQLLISTFTGMRLGTAWDGRQKVNGGYIVVKKDGDVVAFHSTIADEFKDFLVAKMLMEAPSHKRHQDMVIYKDGDKFFLKLGLQLRFELNR